ncbi:MFS transporter [Methylocella tundrae]|uniref:MFS transporter n=1 Tax=Methylocella tundrae TaxID=227605 RepID=A0A8B6M2U7_METTU|nr:MFS transporter [Methylocella tundrae]VTZ49166.1 MFS transporter [Methylocella tundrae]
MAVVTISREEIARTAPMTDAEKRVILASSLGTVFDWYDFYLYGSLASIIGAQFFSQFPKATADIFALLAFAAGFVVRPFGALVFGRLGDLVGRKYTFLLTILIMGFSTFIVGFLPNYHAIGIAAPIILIGARLLQGLALGGEYGGAATYVAEHAPAGRRGFYTSWIQTTATLGLFLSLLVILFTRSIFGEPAFASFAWRIPFLVSVVLLGVSLWIRLKLNESPAFLRMKQNGAGSKTPLREAFGNWPNAKIALLALFGLTMGQGVVWYTGQFYALVFMQSILKVDGYTANLLIAWSLVLGTGFFVFFGWLSDKIGRKTVIMFGCLAAAATYFPIFQRITTYANPALAAALENVSVTVVANPANCGSLFNPIGTRSFTAPCDIARDVLAKSSVKYTRVDTAIEEPVKILIGSKEIAVPDASDVAADPKAVRAAFDMKLTAALQDAGYPDANDPGIVKMSNPLDIFRPQVAGIIGLLFVLVLYVTMVYGPIAAALVELFPTRIRYTSLSLPYHIGNGWFGGLLPATAFAMVAQTGDIYYGLWYPIIIAMACFVIGVLFVPETKDRDIYAQD